MKVTAYVAGIDNETWFRGTRDERQVKQLNLLDSEPHLGMKLKATFAYTPDAEELKEINIEKLEGAHVTLAISEIKAGNGGRMTFKGKIDRSTLPKDSLLNPGAGAPRPGASGAGNTK